MTTFVTAPVQLIAFAPQLQYQEIPSPGVIHQGVAQMGFLQRAVQHNATGNIRQFHNGGSDHAHDVTEACHCEDWLGI